MTWLALLATVSLVPAARLGGFSRPPLYVVVGLTLFGLMAVAPQETALPVPRTAFATAVAGVAAADAPCRCSSGHR